MKTSHPLVQSLQDKSSFIRQIHKIHNKNLKRNKLFHVDAMGISVHDIYYNRAELANIIRRIVQQQDYHFQSVTPRQIVTGTKKRTILTPCLSDQIIQGIIYDYCLELLLKTISPHVHSYRKQHSSQTGILATTKFIKEHLAKSEKKQTELYIFHSDVKEYTDSIPLHENAHIWDKLRRLFETHGPLPDFMWRLLQDMLRPEILEKDAKYQRIRGIATGAIITPIIANLYLEEVDHYLSNIADGKYVRYGDDILFLHPDKEIIKKSNEEITRIITMLGLKLNSKKTEYLYFTKPGKPHPTEPAEFKGVNHVEFLGYKINADGTIGLKKATIRAFLNLLDKRIRTTQRLFQPEASLNEKGLVLCMMINSTLDINHSLCWKRLKSINTFIDDRNQLKQLDFMIMLRVAKALTNRQGVSAFNIVSPKKIRQEWELASLSYWVNKSRHHKAQDINLIQK